MRDLKTYLSVAPVVSTIWFWTLAGLLIEINQISVTNPLPLPTEGVVGCYRVFTKLYFIITPLSTEGSYYKLL